MNKYFKIFKEIGFAEYILMIRNTPEIKKEIIDWLNPPTHRKTNK